MVKKRYKVISILFIIIFFFTGILAYGNEISRIYSSLFISLHHTNTGKKLIIGRAGDSISLDPSNTTDMDSTKVTINIFETLVKYEKEGKDIIPGLATSWKSSEDGLTWVFRVTVQMCPF